MLVLVPVVLGAGTSLTATYGDALTSLLRLPQSVGLVGGPPGASLFLLGHQAQQVCPVCPSTFQPSTQSQEGFSHRESSLPRCRTRHTGVLSGSA